MCANFGFGALGGQFDRGFVLDLRWRSRLRCATLGQARSETARTGIDLEAGLLSDYRFEKVNDPFKARMKK